MAIFKGPRRRRKVHAQGISESAWVVTMLLVFFPSEDNTKRKRIAGLPWCHRFAGEPASLDMYDFLPQASVKPFLDPQGLKGRRMQ
jgi:hypothetical protein